MIDLDGATSAVLTALRMLEEDGHRSISLDDWRDMSRIKGEPFGEAVDRLLEWGDVITNGDTFAIAAPGHERSEPDHGRYLQLVPASSIRIDRPRWVWDQRIPVGGTTLMAGREGMGKTLLVCWLAASITRGRLPGEWHRRPGRVIYIGHEDDRATVLVPRLEAAGADLDRFLFVDIPAGGTFSLNVDLDALLAAAAGQDVALIVVDPLDSHLGGIDSHKKAEVQAAVARLAGAAQQLRCGALGLAHFNKAAVTDLLTRVVGSVGFTTSVRSVLAVGEHPDDPTERICVLGKANMTDRSQVPAIRFKAMPATLDHPDGGLQIATARVEILGEIDGFDPDRLLTASQDREERSALDRAVDWLADMLTDGPIPRSEAITLGKREGHAERTLERAAERYGVVVTRAEGVKGRPSTWSAPDYPPLVSRQTPVAGNQQAPDQGKHHPEGGLPPLVTDGGKPNLATCEACGEPMALLAEGQRRHPSCEPLEQF